jgi:signal transduction histidine kinase
MGMSALVDHAVWGPLDAELREEAETVCSLRDAGAIDDMRRAAEAVVRERTPGPDKFVRVWGGDGTVLARAGRVPAHVGRRPQTEASVQAVRVPGKRQPYRVVWHATSDACAAVVGTLAGPYARTLRHARLAIATGAGGTLLVLSVLAWTITGRATAELGRLAGEIETIEAGSLQRRLVPRRILEVDRLAVVLNRLLERLEAAMTHLRRFTADAAHELRTPVAALRARLEVALGGPASERAYRDGLLDALEQTERLGTLAEHLLALSAVEAGVGSGPTEAVRLDALVREVGESLEPVAQEQGRRFECAAPLPVIVEGKPQLLKRVLLNLADNAFRHTPPGSGLRIAAGANGDTAVVEVSDEGPGIPGEDLPGVFERFHRGRRAGAGTGLGLALCREIVVQHRGSIVMESDPAGGTTVRVQLPLGSERK